MLQDCKTHFERGLFFLLLLIAAEVIYMHIGRISASEKKKKHSSFLPPVSKLTLFSSSFPQGSHNELSVVSGAAMVTW